MTLDKSPNLVHCSVPAYEMELTVPFSRDVVTLDYDCSWPRVGVTVSAQPLGAPPSFQPSSPEPLGNSPAEWEVNSGCLIFVAQTPSPASSSGGPQLWLTRLRDGAVTLPMADIVTQLPLRQGSPTK